MTDTVKKVLYGAAILLVAVIAFLVGKGLIGGALEHSIQFTINVGVSGDFAIDITPKDVTCIKGQTLTFQIVATPSGGFDADIQLVLSGLPTGSYTFSRDVLPAGDYTATLTVNTATFESNTSYACTLSAHDI